MCLNFTLEDLQPPRSVFIKKNNISICVSFDMTSTYIFGNTEGKRLHNCTCSTKEISVCFGNFQQTDAGFFSLHTSTGDVPSLGNIILKQASIIFVFLLIHFVYDIENEKKNTNIMLLGTCGSKFVNIILLQLT